jgi:hypothetical protein
MKAGNFNIHDYLEKLNENSTDGNLKGDVGQIIPEENKKSFSWLKKEYDKSKVEVKVEINMGGSKFQPGYELQTDLKSVKDFKPGMYGDVKTSDTPGAKKDNSDSAETTAEKEGNKPEAEKKAEASTGDKGPKSKISAKVKTTDESDKNPVKKEAKKKEDDKT